MNKEELLSLLKKGEVSFEYTKMNGDKRIVRATLEESVLPPVKGGTPPRTGNYVTVWDLDKEQWRTLHVDQIGDEIMAP